MKINLFLIITLAFCVAGCGDPPLVVQGTVTAYNAVERALTVKDENPPNKELTFSLADADVGGEPVIGDVVRLSYRNNKGTLTAIRVMNLSHQAELQKK
jgi:hypothetical protein